MVRLACLLSLLFLAQPAAAEDACTAAVTRVCPQSRGDLLMLGCFRTHHQELAQACKGDLKPILDRAEKIAGSCKRDAKDHCSKVQPGEGRVAACLKENEHQLSAQCQDAFNTWRLMKSEFTSACWGDIGKLCQMVPQGGGAVWACLKNQKDQLSGQCRDAMDKL